MGQVLHFNPFIDYRGQKYLVTSFRIESRLNYGISAAMKLDKSIPALEADEPIVFWLKDRWSHLVIQDYEHYIFPRDGVLIKAAALINSLKPASLDVFSNKDESAFSDWSTQRKWTFCHFNGHKLFSPSSHLDIKGINIIADGTALDIVRHICTQWDRHFRIPQTKEKLENHHNVLEIGRPEESGCTSVLILQIAESANHWTVLLDRDSEIPLVGAKVEGTMMKSNVSLTIQGVVSDLIIERKEQQTEIGMLPRIEVWLTVLKKLELLPHHCQFFDSKKEPLGQDVTFDSVIPGIVSKVDPLTITCNVGGEKRNVRGTMYGLSALKGKIQLQTPLTNGDSVLALWPEKGLFFGDIPVFPLAAIEQIPEMLAMIAPKMTIAPGLSVEAEKLEIRTKGIDINSL